MCSPVTTTAGLTGRATTYHTMELQYFWRNILEEHFGGIFGRDILVGRRKLMCSPVTTILQD